MLAIKLKMVGRRNQRTFRVIVQEARAKLGGKFVDDLGWYNPHTNQFKVNKERVEHWIKSGAQPTESVEKLLKKVESSEVASYEAREGRKKKKGPKGEEGAGAEEAPMTEGEESPEPANEGETETASPEPAQEEPKQEEVKQEEQKEEPAPTSEKAQEEVKEEAPAEEPKKEAPAEPEEVEEKKEDN